MYVQERIPPADIGSPDSDGYYRFDSIPLGMIQGWYYLPYRLTDWQWKWAAISCAVGASSWILGILFFWVVRRVPWSPAKYAVVNLVFADRVLVFFNATLWHPSAVLYGSHWHGYYTCQVMGYVGAFWGITSQSFTFLFILERYMSLVHRFTVNNWQAKQMVLSVYISGLVIGATPFMFGRRSSVAPTGVYCRPIWSNGGDWVGFFVGILALMFVSANLIGAAVMYLRIYLTFVRVTRQAERAVGGGGTIIDANANAKRTTSDEVAVRFVPTKSILAFKKGCAVELHQQSTAIAYALAKQAFTYYLVHAICNTPLAYEFVHHVIFQLPPPAWYDLLVYMATFLFTITNCILLVFLNQHYRMAALEEWEDWKNRLRKLFSRR